LIRGLVVLTSDDIRRVEVSDFELSLARAMAARCELGGRSNVRTANRQELLGVDQFVGQVGTLALSLYWYGSLSPYLAARKKADVKRWQGDGGVDLEGRAVDVKTSLMRSSRDPLDYCLIVSPREVHSDWTYVLSLIPDARARYVYLVGWATTEDLGGAGRDRRFPGKHVVSARSLRALPPMRLLSGA
jgi:hypothetical protein